jgi:transposase-like protein
MKTEKDETAVYCPKCDAFLTNDVQKAYCYVGNRSLWKCKNCGATPWAKKKEEE